MKISELAELTQLTTSRIRFYEQQGLIAPVQRKANGYRDYTQDAVASLQFIQIGQSLGFTLEEIKPFLGLTEAVDHQKALHLLKQKQLGINNLIIELQDKKNSINKLVSMLNKREEGDACIEPNHVIELFTKQ